MPVTFITPEETMKRAQDAVLGGREPQTEEEAMACFNCILYNVPNEIMAPIGFLMAVLFPQYFGKFSDSYIEAVAEFQSAQRRRKDA